MAELEINQKTIFELFSSKNSNFLVPDYQRPYAWKKEQCETLWNDLTEFTLPQKNPKLFNENKDYYFLGPIVTCANDDLKEIIAGQQRITNLLLLLRAFYEKFREAVEDETKWVRDCIEKCIWKTSAFGKPDFNQLKIDSDVATDIEKNEPIEILKTGEVQDNQFSNYAKNYRWFKDKISEFSNNRPTHVFLYPIVY